MEMLLGPPACREKGYVVGVCGQRERRVGPPARKKGDMRLGVWIWRCWWDLLLAGKGDMRLVCVEMEMLVGHPARMKGDMRLVCVEMDVLVGHPARMKGGMSLKVWK